MANKIFQKRIADEVEKLLAEKSRARETFRIHIIKFNKQWQKYQEAKQKEEKTGEPQPFCPNPSRWQGEKQVCYYTYLAVVYDCVKNVAPYYLCDDILDDGLFGWLQRQISSANFENDKLTTAIRWVEYELASTNQNGKEGDTQNGNVLTGEPLALAMLVEHPDWPDTKIAKAIGISRTTLYDWPNFKKAKQALKESKNHLPKGSKDGETGNMEAWDEKD